MIRRISLVNFQNHEESTLTLNPGVNVIRGENDQGKSAVIKALVWAATNRPQGSGFRKRGLIKSEETSVTIELDNGIVRRVRDGGDLNQYEVTAGDSAPVYLKALRTDVPAEVSAVLDMNAVNFQRQYDGFFLIGQSGGEVARELNQAVGLGLIDSVLSRAAARVGSAKSRMAACRDARDVAREELERFGDVSGLSAKADALETHAARIEGLHDDVGSIASSIQSIKVADETMARSKALMVHASKLRAIQKENEEADALYEEISQLEQLVKELHALEVMQRFAPTKEAKNTMNECLKLSLIVSNAARDYKNLGIAIISLESDTRTLGLLRSRVESATEDLKTAMSELKHCPTCGTKLSRAQVQSIISNHEE